VDFGQVPEINLSRPIREDTWQKSAYFKGKRKLRVEKSEDRRYEGIAAIDPGGDTRQRIISFR
jgi:hypothetical protein